MVVDEDGNWELTLTDPLSDDGHTVTAVQTDPAGNVSDPAEVTFTVDTDAPDAPVITAPANGSMINDPTPTVIGTGEPGAVITVSVDGTEVADDVVVDEDGNWELTLTDPLSDDVHTVTAVQTDPAGNVSDPAEVTFTVDTDAPDAPVITAPAKGSAISDPTPTVVGTGEPGAVITVSVDGTEVADDVVVDEDGNWELTLTDPLSDDGHTVTAVQTDPAGNVSDPAEVTFTVDTDAPDAPVITTPTNNAVISDTTPTIAGTGEAGATIALELNGLQIADDIPVDGTGAWSYAITDPLTDAVYTVTATQTDDGGNTSPEATSTFTLETGIPEPPVITAPEDGSTINDDTPTITGTGEPGATVTVSIDGTEIGTSPVSSAGSWSVPTTTALTGGEHTATAIQTDPAGNVSPEASSTFTVDTEVPDPPVIIAPADGSTINDSTPTITGTGEPGATITVSVDGTEIADDVLVDDDGNWSLPLTAPLADGEHTVSATQTDRAGNESPEASSTFTVDTADPLAPVIIAPADGSTINDSTPTVTGTGEPGATVTVSVDGTEIADDVLVDDDGNWSLPLTAPLADGVHTATALQTDPAGNVSPEASSTFTVDTEVPDPPVIIAPADGSTINDSTPTIIGTGEPGATITVSVDGRRDRRRRPGRR